MITSDPSAGRLRPRAPRLRHGAVGLSCLLGLALVVGLTLVVRMPTLPNPFASDKVERSQPPLLRALEDLAQYRASSAQFELVLDVEEQASYMPSFLKGERTVFVAAGSVDAYVDFSEVSEEAIDVGADKKSVTITLPPARLADPRVDPARSYVAVRDRGVLDRLGSAFSDNPAGEREFYLLAEKRMTRAARESGAREAAERNTTAMLNGLVRSLGFNDVRVDFRPSRSTG